MTLYTNLAATAVKLLAKYGRDVVLRDVTLGSYNPATGVAASTPSDTTRKGALFDFKDGVSVAAGVLVQVGDKKLLLDATAPPPRIQDAVIIDGFQWSVIAFKEISPAGVPVAYEVHLRK